jgi:aryl-alcohol dehydrogenase-like predicted oxidoreductase
MEPSPTVSKQRLGFGSWQLANPLWGKMSDHEAILLLRAAYLKGIRFFDTAPNYAGGKSEQLIGEALSPFRQTITINSKFGHGIDGKINFSINRLESSIRGSLARLKTSYLDSVLLHNPPLDILTNGSGHFDALEHLKKNGLINAYGASIDRVDEILTILAHPGVEVLEVLFNVFFQAPRSTFEAIAKRGIKLIIKVPFDSGWLTGKYHADSIFSGIRSRWSIETITHRSLLIQNLKEHFKVEDFTPIALRFLYSYPAIDVIIPGIKSMEQLHQLITIPQTPLTIAERSYLEQFYDEKIKDHPLPW